MATVHREPNRVKWIGVRPGHEGEQVIKYATATNAVVDIYEVPADKLLLIFGYFLNAYGGAAGEGMLDLYTAVPAFWKRLFWAGVHVNNDLAVSRNYTIPIEVPAGYFVSVESSIAACVIKAGFDGILIDA